MRYNRVMENQDNLGKKIFIKEEKGRFISEWQASEKSKMKYTTENGLKYYQFFHRCVTVEISLLQPPFDRKKYPPDNLTFNPNSSNCFRRFLLGAENGDEVGALLAEFPVRPATLKT